MEDLFGKIDCRSKYDSVVMRLLRSAMDKAHEQVQNMNGPMEFLHERSKFYEFASILVEGGLSIMEEETDDIDHESNREKIICDLMEIKNWLQGRNEEMKMLIIEKDRELMESLENELKIRHALELSERELVNLRDKLELERTNTDKVEDFLEKNQEDEDNNERDLQELKYKALKIKLHDYESARRKKSLSNVSDSEVYSRIFDNDRSPISARSVEDELHKHEQFFDIKPSNRTFKPSKNNKMIQQMSSDITILKKNLGLAFGKMQNTKILPLEKQWRWSIEKDLIFGFFKGFIIDLQQNFNYDLESICDELNALRNQNIASSKKRSSPQEDGCLKREFLLWKGSPAFVSTDTKVVQLHSGILRTITRLNNIIACYKNPIKPRRRTQEKIINSKALEEESSSSLDILVEYLKSELCSIFLQETLKEWNLGHNAKNSVSTKFITKDSKQEEIEKMCQENIGSFIREEIYMVYFRNLSNAWKREREENEMKMNIRENIYQVFIFEQMREAHMIVQTVNEVIKSYPSVHSEFMGFEQLVHKNLDKKSCRLEDLKKKVNSLAQIMGSIKERKMLYKKAFLNRCINLQLAENEQNRIFPQFQRYLNKIGNWQVDLLGNQVEKLLSLLRKISLIFHQNAKVMSSSNEVSEILHLINKELHES